MGVVFSTEIMRRCFSFEKTSARILIVGLDSAGKSTLVARFKNLVDLQMNTEAFYMEDIVTKPTFVYHVETIHPRFAPLALNLWDLGGQEKTRDLWRFYFAGVEGVVFVIDCTDRQRLTLATRELIDLSADLHNRSSSSIPIFIAVNKLDLSTSLTIEDMDSMLSLPQIQSGEWKIFEISAYTGIVTDLKKQK